MRDPCGRAPAAAPRRWRSSAMMSPVFERVPDLVNANAALVRRGRFLTVTFLVESGATQYLVRVVEGRVTRVERGPFLMRDWAFAIRASDEAWRKFWEPVPAAGYQDVLAMAKFGHALIEGDLLVLMQNLRYVQELLRSPGARVTREASTPPLAEGHIEPITGRYVHVTLGGSRHRVYFEEAGGGIPLVCLHTA